MGQRNPEKSPVEDGLCKDPMDFVWVEKPSNIGDFNRSLIGFRWL